MSALRLMALLGVVLSFGAATVHAHEDEADGHDAETLCAVCVVTAGKTCSLEPGRVDPLGPSALWIAVPVRAATFAAVKVRAATFATPRAPPLPSA